MTEPKELFEQTTAWASEKIAAVEDFSVATPCSEWDARTVVNHVVAGLKIVSDAIADREPDKSLLSDDLVGSDPGSAYEEARAAAVKAVQDAPLDVTWQTPFGESKAQRLLTIYAVDNLTHGWDVAKASGQDTDIPTALAEAAFEVVDGNIPDGARGEDGPFGPRVEVPADASPQDKLLGYLGRRP
jgi:uncharacterized protein (TIGR03086 family)